MHKTDLLVLKLTNYNMKFRNSNSEGQEWLVLGKVKTLSTSNIRYIKATFEIFPYLFILGEKKGSNSITDIVKN